MACTWIKLHFRPYHRLVRLRIVLGTIRTNVRYEKQLVPGTNVAACHLDTNAGHPQADRIAGTLVS